MDPAVLGASPLSLGGTGGSRQARLLAALRPLPSERDAREVQWAARMLVGARDMHKFFAGFTVEGACRVLAGATLVEVPDGTAVYRQYDGADCAYIILGVCLPHWYCNLSSADSVCCVCLRARC